MPDLYLIAKGDPPVYLAHKKWVEDPNAAAKMTKAAADRCLEKLMKTQQEKLTVVPA